jgi:uncharacterized protein YfiM (DUF2279 family)
VINRPMKQAWSILLPIAAASGMTATALQAQALAPAAIRSIRPHTLPPARSPAPPDAWFAEDKLRHMGASAAIQLMGFGLLRIAGASKRASLACATVVTAAAGIGKELRDARTGGDPSVRDLVWDGVGILAGTGLSRLGDGR